MKVVQRVFDASRKGQKMVANIYTSPSNSSIKQQRKLTVVLAHANGFHKELWEPALERMFNYQSSDNCSWRIDQAIALDAYNHGDSAILNRKLIEAETYSPWFENARDILAVISQLGHSIPPIIGIGHSFGAASLLLAENMSPLTFVSLIAADPVLFNCVQYDTSSMTKMTLRRRAQWDNEQAARKYFEPHPFFRSWDKRILSLHLQHGLERDHKGGLRLKCRPSNEASVYAGSDYASVHTTQNLWKIQCPTTFVTGSASIPSPPDYIAKNIEKMPDYRHEIVDGAGHLVVYEKPDVVADHCINALDSVCKPKLAKS